MAVRRFRQAAPCPARQKARLLRQLCSPGGSQDRSGNDPVQGRIDPGLVSPPARVQRRPASGNHRHSRHGQLQGDQRGPGQRSLDDEGRCRSGHRRTRPVRKSVAWNLRLDAELDRCRTGGDGLAGAPSRDRSAEGRRYRYELRLVFRHHRGCERAACCRHRGHFHLSRARMSYDLRGGFTDLQEALHVDVELHRRIEVQRIRQDADLGGPCREDPQSLSGGGRRSRRAQSARAHRAYDPRHERTAAARDLCRQPALGGQRAGRQSGSIPADAGRRLADGAAQRQAAQERTLAGGVDGAGRQEHVVTAKRARDAWQAPAAHR